MAARGTGPGAPGGVRGRPSASNDVTDRDTNQPGWRSKWPQRDWKRPRRDAEQQLKRCKRLQTEMKGLETTTKTKKTHMRTTEEHQMSRMTKTRLTSTKKHKKITNNWQNNDIKTHNNKESLCVFWFPWSTELWDHTSHWTHTTRSLRSNKRRSTQQWGNANAFHVNTLNRSWSKASPWRASVIRWARVSSLRLLRD